MVIEHTVVTTLQAAQALDACAQILTPLGFKPATPEPAGDDQGRPARDPGLPPIESGEWARGVNRQSFRMGTLNTAQRIRVDFDRGRVSIAASIATPGRPPKRLRELHIELADALGRAAQGLQTPAEAGANAAALDGAIRKRDRIGCTAVLLLVLLPLAVGAVLIIIAAAGA